MDNLSIANLYRFHRSTYPARPAIALQRAREDREKGNARYSSVYWWSRRGANIGAPFGDNGLRYVEETSKAGFRFVGWVDEITKREGYFRSIDHKGWYTDSLYQSEVCRGAVYQLPARKGKPLYFAAYREGCESRSGWKDSAYLDDNGAAIVEFGYSLAQRVALYDSPWEAAKAADGLAESAAESQREYNDSWQQARQWQDLGEQMQETRSDARQLVRDMRAAIKSGIAAAPSICSALRDRLRALLDQWEELRTEREGIADSFWYMENGKSVSVAEFTRVHL